MEPLGWRPWVLTHEAEGTLPLLIPSAQVVRVERHPQMNDAARDGSRARITGTAQRGLSWPGEWCRRIVTGAGLRFRSIDYTCLTWLRAVKRHWGEIEDRLPRIDLVLGTFGPAAPLWLARRLAAKWEVPWVADFRDLAALLPDGRRWCSRWLDRLVERRLLDGAGAITTVSTTLREILSEHYRLPAAVVYNGWDRAAWTGESREVDRLEGPYLYYAGRWYPERARAARLVLDALVARPGLRWVIRSLGPESAEQEIREEATRRGLSDRVELLAPCDAAQVHRESQASLANLVLDDVTCRERWSRGTLTGKFLEIVATGPAVLAVTRPDSDMGPILQATGKGRVCSNAQEIGDLVSRLERDGKAYSGNWREIGRFSKENQAAVLCRLFDRLSGNVVRVRKSEPLRKVS
jgi:hypothetical protein